METTLPAVRNGFDLTAFTASLDTLPSTRATYAKAAGRFLTWIYDEGIREPKREDVLRYRDQLKEHAAPSTTNAYLTATRRLFDYLESAGQYPNIAKTVKNARRPNGHGHDALTGPEARAVLDTIDRSTIRGLRDYALLNLLTRTGIRSIEAIRADVGDLRREDGESILAVQGKGRDSKDDIVVLTPEALKPIHDYLVARGPVQDSDPLFASLSDRNAGDRLTTRAIRGTVKRYLRTAGYDSKRLSCHSLRHTAVSLAIEGGADLLSAQRMARHADPRTTMIYFHGKDRIRNAAEKMIRL